MRLPLVTFKKFGIEKRDTNKAKLFDSGFGKARLMSEAKVINFLVDYLIK